MPWDLNTYRTVTEHIINLLVHITSTRQQQRVIENSSQLPVSTCVIFSKVCRSSACGAVALCVCICKYESA